jgi:hypothetical protein
MGSLFSCDVFMMDDITSHQKKPYFNFLTSTFKVIEFMARRLFIVIIGRNKGFIDQYIQSSAVNAITLGLEEGCTFFTAATTAQSSR